MLDVNGLAFFIGSIIVGALSWWINRLYSQFDGLQDDYDDLKVRLSVAESRLDGVQACLEKIESRLEKIYQILTQEK